MPPEAGSCSASPLSRTGPALFFSVASLGFVVILARILLPLVFPQPVAEGGTTSTSTVIVGNAAPTVTNVILNNASSVTLTANTTTAVNVNATISDNNGCSDITSGTTTVLLYRSGITSSTCGGSPVNRNYLNCYLLPAFTNSSTCSGGTVDTTSTFNVWYLAEATDASSSYASDNWLATVIFRDPSGDTGEGVSTGREVNTLTGLNVETSSLDYGTLTASSTTGATNQTAEVKNAGNSSTTLRLSGQAMASGGSSIPTSSQHYSTSTFTYNTNDNQLQETPTDVGGFSIPRPPLAVWATTTAYPHAVADYAAVVNNNFAYVIGGCANDTCSANTSSVRYAAVAANGAVGTWETTTAYPSTIVDHFTLVNNGYIYVFGGYVSSVATSTVRYAPVGSTGTIGSWATTTPFPYAICKTRMAAYNNYAYVVAGETICGGDNTSTVLYAPFGSTGTIGSWSTTTPYPHALASHSFIQNGGYLLVIGGSQGVGLGSDTSTVRYAPVGSTGTIGSWSTTTPYPNTIGRTHAITSNGFVYVVGGYASTSAVAEHTSTVRYAPIGSTGTIGLWATGQSYPEDVAGFVALANNGFAYVIGGHDDDFNYTSTVRMASLATRNTYWGLGVPAGTASGTYSGQNLFTAVFQP